MIRIQRKRTSGWKKPDNVVFVDRTNRKWGNPYKIILAGKEWKVITAKTLEPHGTYQTKEDAAIKAVELYRLWVDEEIKEGRLNLSELKDKNLACFCGLNNTCHADYLLKIAANV